MKLCRMVELPAGVDGQAALQRLSGYFEDEWEPRESKLTTDELEITTPRRLSMGENKGGVRGRLDIFAVRSICLTTDDRSLRLEVEMSNLAFLPGLGLGAGMALIGACAWWAGGMGIEGILLPLLGGVPCLVLILPILGLWQYIIGRIRKQVEDVVRGMGQ